MRVCSADIVIELTDSVSINKLHPCVPKNELINFLKFPFAEIAKNLNDASKGLVLLNHPAYKFTHLDDEVREAPSERIQAKWAYDTSQAFKTVLVSTKMYQDFKEDVEKNRYKKWLNDEIIEFFHFG